jgi:hypothetical protein
VGQDAGPSDSQSDKVMLSVLPRKEANYWRIDQLNISTEELHEVF